MRGGILLLLVLLWGVGAAQAQPEYVAQLRRQLASSPPDTNRVRQLGELSWELMDSAPDSSLRYGRQALALAQRLRYHRGELHSLNNLAALAFQVNDVLQATRYYQQAIRVVNLKDPRDSRALALALQGLANIAAGQGNFREAERYYQQVAARLTVPGPGQDPDDLGMLYANLTNFYTEWIETGRAPQAALAAQERYARLAIANYHRGADLNLLGVGLDVLSDVHLRLQHYDSAAICLTQAIVLHRRAGNIHGQAVSTSNLAAVRLQQQQWAAAAQEARASIQLAHQVVIPEVEAKSYDVLGHALLALGDAPAAYRAAQAERQLRDTLQSSARREALARLRVSFDTERKEGRIRELTQGQRLQQARATQQRQRLWALGGLLAVVGAGLAVAAVLALRLRRSRDELTTTRATQDRLYSLVAHDLRSPVLAFEGLADLLTYYVARQDTARLAGLGGRIQQTAQGLRGLLDNLLSWALHQRGELAAAPQAVDAHTILAEAVDLYQAVATTANITVAYTAAPGLRLWADANMTRTIVRNLLGNALKATPTGGSVHLTAEATPHHTATITVQDSGPGFRPEQLARPVARQPTGAADRAGLGLLLSQAFATAQDGTLVLANVPGGGASAVLTLALAGPA
jgi:signal transduction histidine kinase